MTKVLLLEDDKEIADSVVEILTAHNFIVEWVMSGDEALARLRLYQYDIAVFDWIVEGMDGRTACAAYRAHGGTVPILMLTGKSAVPEKLSGFDAGADDYLVKPFAIEEFMARIRALLKRPRELEAEVLEAGDLKLDVKNHTVKKGGQEIELLPKELILLEYFMRHRSRIFSAQDLLDKLWSSESDSTEAAVRKCVTRLRAKIDGENENGYLETIKGLGYKFSPPRTK